MFVVRGVPTKPELRRSDINNKARAFCVAPTGLRLCFRIGLQTFRSYGATGAIYFVSRGACACPGLDPGSHSVLVCHAPPFLIPLSQFLLLETFNRRG